MISTPSSSLSPPNPAAIMDAIARDRSESNWQIFIQNPRQVWAKALHTQRNGETNRYKSKGRGECMKMLTDHPLVQNEVVVTQVQNVNGHRKWAVKPISVLYDAFIQGDAMFLNEFFMPGQPVKAYFDVDLETSSEKTSAQWDAAYSAVAKKVIGTLSFHGGFSADWNDWIILVCPYIGHPEKSKKLSMHFVYRRWKFPSASLLGKWIGSKIPADALRALHIDMQVYGSTQNMRGLGMSKFVPTRSVEGIPDHYPFLSFHPAKLHSEFTQAEYAASLIQFVPGCVAIHVDGESQEMRFMNSHVSSNNRYVDAVLAMLRREGEESGRNSECKAYSISESTIESNFQTSTISFKVENYEGFRYCRCSEDVDVKIYVKAETFSIGCDSCFDRVGVMEYGLNAFSDQMVKEMLFYRFLRSHGFDRVDFPLDGTPSSCGHFGLSKEQFWEGRKSEAKENNKFSPCPCEWCTDDSVIIPRYAGSDLECEIYRNVRNPSILCRDTFFWIQKRYPNKYDDDDLPYSDMLQTFLNLHICVVDSTYYVRGESLTSMKQVDMKEFLGNCQLLLWKEEKKKKKNDPETFYLAKEPIWDHFRKHPGVRIFSGTNNLQLDFGKGSSLNTLAPIELDINQCIQTYHDLLPAEQAMLRNVYVSMIKMFTYREKDRDIRLEAEHYLHRWTNAALFDFYKEKHMVVYIVSHESGGQGKSTYGELIGSYLGLNSGYYKQIDGNGAFGDKFNTFCNGLNVINEVVFKSDQQAQEFKSKIMANSVVVRKMRKDPHNETDRMIFWLTANAFSEHLAGPGMDRRLMVLEIDSIETIDRKDLCYFECDECEDPTECGHSSYSHQDLMTIVKDCISKPALKGDVDFRRGFVGMLHKFYSADRLCYPDKWSRPTGTFCPPTDAGAGLRMMSQNVCERFWCECMKRGYHFVVTITPPANFRGQIYFTEGMKNRFEGAQIGHQKGWERVVPVKTLFQAFSWWCTQVGVRPVSCEKFETMTKLFYRTKIRGKVSLEKEQKKVFCMEWRKNNSETCKWEPTTNPELLEDCWDLGAGKWKIADKSANVRRGNGDRRAQLRMSRSNHALNNSNSPPMLMQEQSFFPLSQQFSQSQSESDGPMFRFGNGILDDENAQDYAEVVRTRGRGSSVDGEDENDIDVRDKKKLKHQYLREVEEGEEDSLQLSASL